jgi:hypothetical protein
MVEVCIMNTDLLDTIRRVRRRWRLALVLRGAAICAAAVLILLALSAFGFARFGLSPHAILTARVLVTLASAAVFVAAVLLPLLRRVSDARVALYIEEREPALQAVLISAVELARDDHGAMARALVDRAARQCREIEFGQRIESQRLQRNGLIFTAVTAVVLLIMAAGPPALRNSARTLLLPAGPAEAAIARTIAVAPGNDTIARGADFTVTARLNGFANADAALVLRTADGEWRRWPMAEGQKPGTFETVLYDVDAATDYYIEADGVRSVTFRVDVVEAPHVRSIALEYVYPAYTGLASRRIDNGGDVVAARGTMVRVIATPSSTAGQGRLRVEGAAPVEMNAATDGTLRGAFRVLRDGLYHIELPDIDGRLTNASAQYAITAIADEPPNVRIEKPGRDVKVSAIDEVFISASAQDDYGISSLDLVYSVNGGAEQKVSLASPRARTPDVTGAHTLFLEELSLKPGDIVAYYARATDNNGVDGARTTTTDIYFVQVRPFSRNYRAAEQAGMPGAGQPQEDPGALSERQRQIIAATFNVVRDRASYTPTGFAEAVTTIELSQRRLREQVATLVQRMQMRGVVEMDSTFAEIAELLPQAGREMATAEEELKRGAANNALPPEQRALQQLLRAEALYRDVQIQMQQQQNPGGGGSSSMADDLADMFELERNQLRNQYEAVQRSRQEQRQQQVDEELARLRELAQRQQQEAERQAAAAQQQQGTPGGGGGAQRRMADEAEQAARRLERLARENASPELAEAARSLEEAADAMRRASAERGGRGTSAANAARERLEEARRRLQGNQQQSLEQQVAAARQRAEQLRQQQERIAAEAEQAGASPSSEQQRRLDRQRSEAGAGIGELETRLDRLEAQARGTNGNAARELGAAADAIRNSRLRERMRAAQGSAQTRSREFNRAQDAQINRDLERVTEQIQRAEAAAGSRSREAQAESAAERARRLAQGIEGMRDRMQSQQRGGQGQGQARRQLESEMRARAGEMRELQRQLRAGGMGGRPLQDAIDALSAAAPALTGRDPEKADRLLAAVAQGLEDLEFDLRQLAVQENQKRLFTSGRGQVPAEYRKAVEEYYRSLGRK